MLILHWVHPLQTTGSWWRVDCHYSSECPLHSCFFSHWVCLCNKWIMQYSDLTYNSQVTASFYLYFGKILFLNCKFGNKKKLSYHTLALINTGKISQILKQTWTWYIGWVYIPFEGQEVSADFIFLLPDPLILLRYTHQHFLMPLLINNSLFSNCIPAHCLHYAECLPTSRFIFLWKTIPGGPCLCQGFPGG